MIRKKRKVIIGAASSSSSSTNPSEIREELKFTNPVSIVRIKVKVGEEVVKGQGIVSGRLLSNEEEIVTLTAKHDGVVESISKDEGERVNENDVVLAMKVCLHGIISFGLCANCGKSIEIDKEKEIEGAIVNVQGGYKLLVSLDEAKQKMNEATKRLFNQKKLSLVLDLDHTLLHCSDDPAAMRFAEKKMENVHQFKLQNDSLTLKFRPGLDEFLKICSTYYEMYVYTAATRQYAEMVCSLMDADGTYFGGRIVARTDTPELGLEKSLKRLFPVDDTMVIVVDDKDVWGGVENLLTIQDYHFFLNMHDVNNTSWVPQTGDEEEEEFNKEAKEEEEKLRANQMDEGLQRVCNYLKKIHRKFYVESLTLEKQLSNNGNDVKRILTALKSELLSGLVIGFDPAVPHVEWLAKRAVACGATTLKKAEGCTHFIAMNNQSEAARKAYAMGVRIVKPAWLEKSDHYWEQLKSEKYVIHFDEVKENEGLVHDMDDFDQALEEHVTDYKNSKEESFPP